MAMCNAVQESKFLTQLYHDMNYDDLSCSLYVDNEGAIQLAKNPIHHQRSKHIDIKFHFIREAVRNGQVTFHYVQTGENVADALTKPVCFEKLVKLMH
jgi:hypothetical protein